MWKSSVGAVVHEAIRRGFVVDAIVAGAGPGVVLFGGVQGIGAAGVVWIVGKPIAIVVEGVVAGWGRDEGDGAGV